MRMQCGATSVAGLTPDAAATAADSAPHPPPSSRSWMNRADAADASQPSPNPTVAVSRCALDRGEKRYEEFIIDRWDVGLAPGGATRSRRLAVARCTPLAVLTRQDGRRWIA